MTAYRIEAWSLTSPAAAHESRTLTAEGIIEAASEEEARRRFAEQRGIPRDYYDGVRASAVATRHAVRYHRGQRSEPIIEVTVVGHVPFVLLRVTATKGRAAPRHAPFNAPRMGAVR